MWSIIEPLLPSLPAGHRRPGCKPVLADRKVLCGILFVLYTGIQWEWLPQELGFGSGMTCWRRLRDWNAAGVWQRLHEVLTAAPDHGAGHRRIPHAKHPLTASPQIRGVLQAVAVGFEPAGMTLLTCGFSCEPDKHGDSMPLNPVWSYWIVSRVARATGDAEVR